MYPITLASFKAVEGIFAVQRDQYGDMRPEAGLLPDAHAYGYSTNTKFTDLVAKKAIHPVKNTVDEITTKVPTRDASSFEEEQLTIK